MLFLGLISFCDLVNIIKIFHSFIHSCNNLASIDVNTLKVYSNLPHIFHKSAIEKLIQKIWSSQHRNSEGDALHDRVPFVVGKKCFNGRMGQYLHPRCPTHNQPSISDLWGKIIGSLCATSFHKTHRKGFWLLSNPSAICSSCCFDLTMMLLKET